MNPKYQKLLEELIERKREDCLSKKQIKMKDIGRKGHHFFICEDFSPLQQVSYPEKCFFFERLKRIRFEGTKEKQLLKESETEYRISYYIVGKNGNKKGRWTFGQFCAMIPAEDFRKLIKKAEKDGVLIH